MDFPGFPPSQGLYHPQFEKDGCGIGLIADLNRSPSHSVVSDSLKLLERLAHRGAQGSDPHTGDGAGILFQLPHTFLKRACDFSLPALGQYGAGFVFLPREADARKILESAIEKAIGSEKLELLGWRDVPVDSSAIGELARSTEPVMRQFFVGRGAFAGDDQDFFERRLYILRKVIERAAQASPGFCIPSLSSRTIAYKGLLLPAQMSRYFRDLSETDVTSSLALVHSRFSTNTYPTWPLAHPYRYICHNGEINTLRGNLNWMQARQGMIESPLFSADDIAKLLPVISPRQSDSACLDNMVEFLVMGGRSLPHAMMMLIPEPWTGNPGMDLERRGFYEYHAAMMEPWDGPAAVAFTDGKVIGATLDRNGLRPCRYLRTVDGRVVLSSEAGVLDLEPAQIAEKGRLQPGRMFLIDVETGRMISDDEIKDEMARRRPYRNWVLAHRITLEELPEPLHVEQPTAETLLAQQRVFGYTHEELHRVLLPMFATGEEATSSMGADTPLAVLSHRPQLLFRYFRQLFAQVTNPPIDSIREALVMTLGTHIGPRSNLLGEIPESCQRIRIARPVLTNSELAKIRALPDPKFRSLTLSLLFDPVAGTLARTVERLCQEAEAAAREGVKILILSDRGVSAKCAAVPSLLAVSAINQHLIRTCIRTETGLIVESGEPRDVHHFACLIGFGAGAINPYLAFDTATDFEMQGFLPEGLDAATAQTKYIAALSKGLLKIFSKMGISTVQSYCGAQIFEALGLSKELVEQHFSGISAKIGGAGLPEIEAEALARHRAAFEVSRTGLEMGGQIHYRVGGELHQWNPETISALQHATRSGDADSYQKFSDLIQRHDHFFTLRGLLDFKFERLAVPLEEVESAASIVHRFTTGAMSLGAISPESHETLAIAMNRIGGKSNTGEGGENPARFKPLANGDSKNSAIKQIASARFGVTAEYLVSAREIQIKMAQGAKPGEGGQLPGHKVDATIAGLRYSTPGVQLISPPPHHDIYSIEDLAQLIFDLKNINPKADVSVKLVAEAGVGTIAAGVAKAHADKILISGDSGGTGASPLSSIQYAGMTWEIGLAETHQTLLLNGLRSRVRIEIDGQLKTGRDVMVAALLGADEFGFATAPLIVEGCIMMRKCHLNTCPVGIATQDPILRKRFAGQPEHVVNYFFFVAEEVRTLLGRLGFRSLAEAVGKTEALRVREDFIGATDKTRALDLSALLYQPKPFVPTSVPNCSRETLLQGALDLQWIEAAEPALSLGKSVKIEGRIQNVNRTAGALLSHHIIARHGGAGLPEKNRIEIALQGTAGQSFGAFLVPGVALSLEGEANDYVGKGLSGGMISVRPPSDAAFPTEGATLIGNTALYGATRGSAFIAGAAGERFAVRNSGAVAVVEGTGDHGCEYMTGGTVVVLGTTGRNFAAGMSGGVAFVWDVDQGFRARCNLAMIELEKVKDEDEIQLRKLIERHRELTGSTRAAKILAQWETERDKFVQVVPTEYKRAIAEARRKSREIPAAVAHV